MRTDETEELTNVEYIPASTPIPASLAPGPNTKVTTTIKTYTYELPGAPESYIPPPTTTTSTISKNINVDKSISYTLPAREPEKTITYHVEEQKSGVREYVPAPSPSSSRVRREEKMYVEERRGYRAASPPPPQPLPVTEGSRTTIKQYEEHYSGSSRPPRPTYYPDNTHHSSSSSTHVYKYDEQQSLLPRPFPTSERPASPRQQPPRRIEDLMASFSDSEVRGILLGLL